MPNNYASLDDLKAALPDAIPSSDSSYDVFLGDLLTRASRLLDRETGRHPGAWAVPSADSDHEVRYYTGSGGSEQWTDEMAAAPSEVAFSQDGQVGADSNYTVIPSSDYFLWPENAALNLRPYKRIDLDTINGAYTCFYKYRRGVRVTAPFGYADTDNTPAELQQATLIQAARWFGRARQGYHDAGANPQLGQLNYVQQLDPDVKEIVMHLRRVAI